MGGTQSTEESGNLGTFILAAVLLILAAVILCGCSNTPRKAVSPAAIATAGSVSVSQTGDAETPATASTETGEAVFVLPEGSEVTFSETLGTFTAKLSRDSNVKLNTRKESATAPQAFTPPAPPTPAETAAGRAASVAWIGLVIGVAAAAFGLVRNWNLVALGGSCVAAGCALLLWMQSTPWALPVIGAGVALAVAGPLVWQFVIKPKTANQ